MSAKSEQRIQWRREKIKELSLKGRSQMETTPTIIIATTVAIFTSAAVTMSAIPTPQAYAQDHCSSSQSPTTGGHNTVTSTVITNCNQTHEEAQALKQQCQSAGNLKCSSSQTGFGATRNFFKEHENVPPLK